MRNPEFSREIKYTPGEGINFSDIPVPAEIPVQPSSAEASAKNEHDDLTDKGAIGYRQDQPEVRSAKEEAWMKMEQEVGRIADKLGRPIDPGIRESVVALRVLGLTTDGSCEGHLDHGVRAPWIDIGQ